jgi:hypothetical protein
MASVPFKVTAAAGTNLQPVRAGQAGNFKGYAAVVLAAYPVFLKLYWFTPTAANPTPVVGTTVPNMTIELGVPSTGVGHNEQSYPDGVTGNGQLWMALTKNAVDSDNTALVAGDAIVTVLAE